MYRLGLCAGRSAPPASNFTLTSSTGCYWIEFRYETLVFDRSRGYSRPLSALICIACFGERQPFDDSSRLRGWDGRPESCAAGTPRQSAWRSTAGLRFHNPALRRCLIRIRFGSHDAAEHDRHHRCKRQFQHQQRLYVSNAFNPGVHHSHGQQSRPEGRNECLLDAHCETTSATSSQRC